MRRARRLITPRALVGPMFLPGGYTEGMSAARAPSITGLPPPNASPDVVSAFWYALARHPASPWLAPALTAPETVLPATPHAPAHRPVVRWALGALHHPQGEARLRFLIETGALALDAADPPHGENLTQAALMAGKPGLLEWLLARGAPPPPAAALFLTVRPENADTMVDMLRVFHRAGVPFDGADGYDALERVLVTRDIPRERVGEAVRVLLACGARASLPTPIKSRLGVEGNAVLTEAARRFPELLPALVASAPLHPAEATSALAHAAREAEPKSLACLLEAGVEPVRSSNGRTVLLDLIQGHFDRCRAAGLASAASDPKAAAVLASVDLLLDAGLRADAHGVADDYGLYPLTLAGRSRWPELVERLLPTSAAIWTDRRAQHEPLYTVLSAAPPDRLDAWLDAAVAQGARLDATDTRHETVLHQAMKAGNIPVTLALLARGADPDAPGRIAPPSRLATPEVNAAVIAWRAARELDAGLVPVAAPPSHRSAHRL